MSLYSDLNEVLTPYAQRIKGLTVALDTELHDESIFNDWTKYGTENYPYGWVRGYYAASDGKTPTSASVLSHYIRTVNVSGGRYAPDDSVSEFIASAPSPYAIAVFEWNGEDGSYIGKHGSMYSIGKDATSSVKVQHTPGHTYAFSVGYFENEDSADYVENAEFLSSISITESKNKITAVENDVDGITNNIDNKRELSWNKFGTISYPLGWRVGYRRSSDGTLNQNSTNAICTPGTVYIPPEGVKEFSIEVPNGRSVCVSIYDLDGVYQGNIGTIGSGSDKLKKIVVTPEKNRYYKFAVGYFDGDAEQYITEEFISQIVLTETYYVGRRADENKHLNILLFGNSYFADSFAYVPFMLKKYGITSNIHLYYRGSGSPSRLVAEWEDDTASGYDEFGRSHVRRYSHIDTRYQMSWEGASSSIHFSPKQVLEKGNNDPNIDKWDIIALGPGSRGGAITRPQGNGDPRKGVEPYLRQAINLINASYEKPYHLAWFGSYTPIDGYAGDASKGYPAIPASAMDDRIGTLKSTETIMSAEPFDMIIPAGAAIFNARTNASLASTALSATGNLWCRDRVHLHAGIPNYIANCAVVQSIFKKFYPHLSILGDDTRITDALISSLGCPFITSWCGSVLDDTELLYELGQKAAVLACEHPYDITPIYLPTDTTPLELIDSHSDRYWADALIDTSNIT